MAGPACWEPYFALFGVCSSHLNEHSEDKKQTLCSQCPSTGLVEGKAGVQGERRDFTGRSGNLLDYEMSWLAHSMRVFSEAPPPLRECSKEFLYGRESCPAPPYPDDPGLYLLDHAEAVKSLQFGSSHPEDTAPVFFFLN